MKISCPTDKARTSPEVTSSFFAEFLRAPSPESLRLLAQPTCFGLRYGFSCLSLRSFSRKSKVYRIPFQQVQKFASLLDFIKTDLPVSTTLQFAPTNSVSRLDSSRFVPPQLVTKQPKYRNINLLSIHYACRLWRQSKNSKS